MAGEATPSPNGLEARRQDIQKLLATARELFERHGRKVSVTQELADAVAAGNLSTVKHVLNDQLQALKGSAGRPTKGATR